MKVPVSFSRKTQQDLAELHSYIAGDNPVRARTYLRELAAACLKLGDMPEKGRLPEEVLILRIFSVGQDPGSLFAED